MSKILITGGGGFIGYHLAKKLAASQNEITLADKKFPGPEDAEFASLLTLPGIKTIEGDLTSWTVWQNIGNGYDHVYHLAGINGFKQFQEIPHEVLRVGMATTMHAIEWLDKINKNPRAKILYTSSNEIYVGAEDAFGTLPTPTPEHIPGVVIDTYNPRWSYGGHKLISELFFIHFSSAYKFRTSIVRPHYIYGPRAGLQPLVPKIISRIKNATEPFPLLGKDDSRPYCYVGDAADAMVAVMESDKTDGGTYNIGGNQIISIGQLTETLFDIMDWHPKQFDIKDSPDGKTRHYAADISKIKKDTGWEPSIDIKDGLRKTIEGYL